MNRPELIPDEMVLDVLYQILADRISDNMRKPLSDFENYAVIDMALTLYYYGVIPKEVYAYVLMNMDHEIFMRELKEGFFDDCEFAKANNLQFQHSPR